MSDRMDIHPAAAMDLCRKETCANCRLLIYWSNSGQWLHIDTLKQDCDGTAKPVAAPRLKPVSMATKNWKARLYTQQ